MNTGLRYFIIVLVAFTLFWVFLGAGLWLGFYAWPTFAVAGLVAVTMRVLTAPWTANCIELA